MMNTISHVKLYVVHSVHTAPGHSQKNEISPGAAGCQYKKNKLKSVKSVSCVIPLSYVNPVTNAPNAAMNLPVGGQTSNLLEKVVRSGCRSESSSNPERGLHPPLPDPAKFVKNSHSHKLSWQSSQKPQTVRGITSDYGQKCHTTSSQTDLTRVFQPTIFSPKTRQQVEANLGPKQSEPLPQDRKIQDGDTGNHQDITPTGRVGNLHRLQGRLLPYSNTGTVQEIIEISYPRPDLPVQSTAVRSVDSAHGVHYHSKRGKADGRSEGYKDPPIPRRLVGESHIPPGLSPTYTGPSEDVPRFRLAGEHRKVGAGTKTNFQLCRLPIRPRVRSGSTDTGPVAKPARKNTGTSFPTDLFGKGVFLFLICLFHKNTGIHYSHNTTHETINLPKYMTDIK